jgi:hypothetical protein
MGTRNSSLGDIATGMWSSPLTITWSQDKKCVNHYYTHSPLFLHDVLLNEAREHLYLTDIKHAVLRKCYKYVLTQQTSTKKYKPLKSQLNQALTLLAIKRKRYIISLHTIKTFEGVEVQLHSFLPSAQVGGRWVVDSTSSCFKQGEKFPRYPLKRKLGGSQSWSGRVK